MMRGKPIRALVNLLPVFDLFGFAPFFETYIYPLLTNAFFVVFLTIVLDIALIAVLIYTRRELRLERQNISGAIDVMVRYVQRAEAIWDIMFTPEGRKQIEEFADLAQRAKSMREKLPQIHRPSAPIRTVAPPQTQTTEQGTA
jgi:hypothetical protein